MKMLTESRSYFTKIKSYFIYTFSSSLINLNFYFFGIDYFILFLSAQVCDICGDPFEQFWEEDEEEWHLRNAVRVEGKVSKLIVLFLFPSLELFLSFNYFF